MLEVNIIKNHFKPLYKKNSFIFDDSSIIPNLDNSKNLIISKDIITEDHHFRLSYGGKAISKKLLLSNLSDLSASGATPISYALGCSFGKNCDENFIAEFAQGLKEIQEKYNLFIIGGDTVISNINKSFFSLTIFGEKSKTSNSLKLSNARNGDDIFVTGNIGDSFLGFCILENPRKYSSIDQKIKSYLIKKHLEPKINIEFGKILAENQLANTVTDCSDGLIIDLNNISRESKTSYDLFEDKIPHSTQAQKIISDHNNLKAQINNWGEDYELIFTSANNKKNEIYKIAQKMNIKLTLIGKVKVI